MIKKLLMLLDPITPQGNAMVLIICDIVLSLLVMSMWYVAVMVGFHMMLLVLFLVGLIIGADHIWQRRTKIVFIGFWIFQTIMAVIAPEDVLWWLIIGLVWAKAINDIMTLIVQSTKIKRAKTELEKDLDKLKNMSKNEIDEYILQFIRNNQAYHEGMYRHNSKN